MATIDSVNCPKCNVANPLFARFCADCGSGFSSQVTSVETSNKALIAMLLGVGGFLLCGPFSAVPGLYLAWMEKKALQSSGKSTSLANAALWVNIGAIAFTVAIFFFVFVVCVFAMAMA